MIVDQRRKNANWAVQTPAGFYQDIQFYPYASLAVLMDIRDELQELNRVFACHNALAIPQLLRKIETNTRKKRRRKK